MAYYLRHRSVPDMAYRLRCVLVPDIAHSLRCCSTDLVTSPMGARPPSFAAISPPACQPHGLGQYRVQKKEQCRRVRGRDEQQSVCPYKMGVGEYMDMASSTSHTTTEMAQDGSHTSTELA
eukprot:16380-Rhodomonas_salina.1